MVLSFQGYVKCVDGTDAGTYETLTSKFKSVEINRSLFEGDSMRIVSKKNDADPALDKARAIRFYDGATKLFDGYSRAPDYNRIANSLRDLTNDVYDWRKELEAITIIEDIAYVGKSIDFMMADLCAFANGYGVEKQQTYKYDITKMPYHPSVFNTELISYTPDKSIWAAIMDMTRFMDMADIDIPGQWSVKVDSLQSDNYIYLIPIVLRSENIMGFWDYSLTAVETFKLLQSTATAADILILTNCIIDVNILQLDVTYKNQVGTQNMVTVSIPIGTPIGTYLPITLFSGDTSVTELIMVELNTGGFEPESVYLIGRERGFRKLPNFRLAPPKIINKNYAGLINFSYNTSGSLSTKIVSPTKIKATTTIDSNNFSTSNDTDPSKLSYLKITIVNPTGGDLAGTVEIKLDALSSAAEYSDLFYVRVAAGKTTWRVTKNRYPPPRAIRIYCIDDLTGATIMVEEILHGVCGRSINLFGLRESSASASGFDTQVRIDSFSDGIVELHHAPKVQLSGIVKPEYMDTSDNIGKVIQFYDDILKTDMSFLCMKQNLDFTGTQVKERIEAIRYNIDWEYTE